MPHDVTVVLTAKSVERILREGGTSSWRLNPNYVRQRPYVICTRNAHAKWVEGPETHRSAFLIGKVSDLVPQKGVTTAGKSQIRYLITFSEYAFLDVPDVWKKGDRNPVKYMSLEDFDIDPTQLDWRGMPERHQSAGEAALSQSDSERPLTIAAAKAGLAMTFGVDPGAIEIIVRG